MVTQQNSHTVGATDDHDSAQPHTSHSCGLQHECKRHSQQLIASQGHQRDEPHSTRGSVTKEASLRTTAVLVPPPSNKPTTTTTQQTQTPIEQSTLHMQDNLIPELLCHADDERLGGDAHDTYLKSPEEPPITPDSLSELETTRIFNNPKLRHDVNFDRELHFRPNTDGPRGKQKLKSAKRFWRAIEYELRYIETAHQRRRITTDPLIDEMLKKSIQNISKRLRTVFAAVRDILKSLVPEAEQNKIMERLDVDFLMQQITNGVLDLVDLARWLATVIKTHCAPMRDAKVNVMEQTVIIADATRDLSQLTEGLRQLVDIMEAMKLDVANHQIRHIRLLLIKNTVDFQQRYNRHRIQAGKMDIRKSVAWLTSEIDLTEDEALASTPLEAICSALLWDLISPQGTESEPFTPTFYLDYDRLRTLSAEITTSICREVCHTVLLRLLPASSSSSYILEAQSKLQAFLAAEVAPQDWFQNNIENIAASIADIVAKAPESQSCVVVDEEEEAICQDAVEQLEQDLSKSSPEFATHKATLFHRVLPKLQESVQKHINFSALELQEALVPQVAKSTSARSTGYGAVLHLAKPSVLADHDTALVRRLTHIIVLHWQVWADLLYLNEPEIVRAMRNDSTASTVNSILASFVNGRDIAGIDVGALSPYDSAGETTTHSVDYAESATTDNSPPP